MLHIISANTIASLNQCQQCLQESDSILFIGDGVYLIIQNNLIKSRQAINYYALKDAVAARGIEQQMPTYIKLINYDKFVELTEIHSTNQMW